MLILVLNPQKMRLLIALEIRKLLFYPLNYRGSCFQGTKLMFKFEKGK